MRGVPLRLEIGPKDLEKSQVVLARRDTREKSFVPMDGLAAHVERMLDARSSTRCSTARWRSATSTPPRPTPTTSSRPIMDGRPGFVVSPWCGSARVRGRDQERDAGHDPQHSVHQPAGDGQACIKCARRPPRTPGSRRRTEIAVASRRPHALAGNPRPLARVDRFTTGVAAGQAAAAAMMSVAASARRSRHQGSAGAAAQARASGSRHVSSPTMATAVRKSSGRGDVGGVEGSPAGRRAPTRLPRRASDDVGGAADTAPFVAARASAAAGARARGRRRARRARVASEAAAPCAGQPLERPGRVRGRACRRAPGRVVARMGATRCAGRSDSASSAASRTRAVGSGPARQPSAPPAPRCPAPGRANREALRRPPTPPRRRSPVSARRATASARASSVPSSDVEGRRARGLGGARRHDERTQLPESRARR